MALSTPRLVLLVFGVLLVVCGISVGVSEAFKHDRTTTTTINRHIERVDTVDGVRVRGRVPATIAERYARFAVANGAS